MIRMRAHKERSDRRIGGIGYEGSLMTGEVLTQRKRRKSIPLLHKGNWTAGIPSWLSGS